MTDIEKAKAFLKKEDATFAAVNAGDIYISHDRGVAPILRKIDENRDFFNGAAVADKVIGKAAAMLLAKYGVVEIHTALVSKKALVYLENKSVKITYDSVVDHIINRNKTDMCPMEKCVLITDDEGEAEILIRKKRDELKEK